MTKDSVAEDCMLKNSVVKRFNAFTLRKRRADGDGNRRLCLTCDCPPMPYSKPTSFILLESPVIDVSSYILYLVTVTPA